MAEEKENKVIMFPSKKAPEIEEFLENIAVETFGRSRKDPVCVTCGSTKVEYSDFTDDLSRKEFTLSRMCQKCQDEVFDADDDEDD